MFGSDKEKLKSTEVNFIDDSRQALLRKTPRFTKSILYLLLGVILAAIAWANYAVIDLVTVAQGQVESSANLQVIQNLEGGIIKSIDVKEGERVKKDQILARFDDTRFSAAYKRELAKKALLEVNMIRLETMARGDEKLEFPEDLKQNNPDMVASAIDFYNKERKSLEEQLNFLKSNAALIEKELRIISPLAERGALSSLEKIRLERELNSIKGRIKEREERARNDALDELNKMKAEYAILMEQIAASEDRNKRTAVRSPVDGVVNKVYISTIGEVISPGVKIMDIVPSGDQLSLVVKVSPADIGFIKVGQTAQVKVSAYDYSVYGTLHAEITNIGADALTDKAGNNFYEIKLKSSQNHLGPDANPLKIMPGMTVTANIITGRRSVLDFLIKPFIDIGDSAFKTR